MKKEINWQKRKNQEEDCEIELKKVIKIKLTYLKTNKHELTEIQHAETAQELAEDEKHSDYSD